MPLLKKRHHGESRVGQCQQKASQLPQLDDTDTAAFGSSGKFEDLHVEALICSLPTAAGAGPQAPFKMPMPGFQRSQPCSGTLGMRRMGTSALMAGLTRSVNMNQGALSASAGPAGQALLIFDPANPEDCPARQDRETLRKVHIEAFIAAKLRPHQVEGVKFMVECLMGLRDASHTGCVLADGMGVGKTFQSIAALYICMTTSADSNKPVCSRPLILCPSSLVCQWGKELHKWLEGRVEALTCDDSRAVMVKDTIGRFGTFSRKPQALVMSYSTFRLHRAAVSKKHVDMVLCDEAHFLKNGASQITSAVASLSAKVRLLLTGTPIQNDLMEFFTLFSLCVPGLLGELSMFRKAYEIPILRSQDADATDGEVERGQQASSRLLSLCGAFMLRRTSNVNKQYLPPCVNTTVFCQMSTLQQRLYNFFLASVPVQRALNGKAGADGGPDLHVLPAISALKKLCCHPDLVYAMQLPPSQISASNAMHPVITGFEGCLPVFSEPPACPVYVPRGGQLWHSGKLLVLVHLLKAVREHYKTDKCVLVSNYTETLNLMGQICTINSWQYLQLDGSATARTRQGLVEQFNNPEDPSFILLLSSKAGGTGLNIIGANRLMLLDPDWNPANDAQAMARVWREGQTRQVWIYRLLVTGSIEEKIYQRQLAKMGLSTRMVDDHANQARQFNGEELRALFKVEGATTCSTHEALKCKCDGKHATALRKQEAALQRKIAAAGDKSRNIRADSSGEQAEKDGVMAWAHLADPLHSPDDVWQKLPAHVRDRYVTFIFSDHVVDPDVPTLEEEPDDDQVGVDPDSDE